MRGAGNAYYKKISALTEFLLQDHILENIYQKYTELKGRVKQHRAEQRAINIKDYSQHKTENNVVDGLAKIHVQKSSK